LAEISRRPREPSVIPFVETFGKPVFLSSHEQSEPEA